MLYLTIAFNVGSEVFLAYGSTSWNSGIVKLFTTLEKN